MLRNESYAIALSKTTFTNWANAASVAIKVLIVAQVQFKLGKIPTCSLYKNYATSISPFF